MKATNNGDTISGIGRRRGASSSSASKNVSISAIVFAGSFILVSVLLFIISHNLSVANQDTSSSYIDAPSSRGSIRKSQNNINVPFYDGEWGEIMRGEVNLVEIDVHRMRDTTDGYYKGAKAIFCKLDWDAYKKDPPSLPMFRFLVSKSDCNDSQNQISVDLAAIAKKARASSGVKSMNPTGFVFHESRVGSTLVANSLTAMNPAANRVYSESNPINSALKTDNPQLFRDVVYLMGLTNSAEENNMFFKVSSIGSKKISLVREAFPTAPWIFVYRDPVQTMMSHLDPRKVGSSSRSGHIQAVCTRARRHPEQDLIDLVAQQGRTVEEISDHEFCAAHLASLCQSALNELKKSNTGRAVEYDGLIDKLIDDIIPNHFGVPVGMESRQRIMEVSKTYSKARGDNDADWVEDSAKKEEQSTEEIRNASELFLSKPYSELQKYSD